MWKMSVSLMLQVLATQSLLIVSGVEVQAAITSPLAFKVVGCFKDKHAEPRPLPRLIANLRDNIEWNNLNKTIFECARIALKHHFLYFGIQFWGECWSGDNAEETYFIDGTSKECFAGVGKDFANFVYKFIDLESPTTGRPILNYTSTPFLSTMRTTKTTLPTTQPSICFNSDTFLPGCECERYKDLSSPRRSQLTLGGAAECDRDLLVTWYRFTGEAGDRMPTQCVPRRHCGTHAPGWLQGSHPLVGEGVVKRTVCFSWRWDCCFWQQEVSVRNCGGFYVYRLQPPPACRLRYCGNGKQNEDDNAL